MVEDEPSQHAVVYSRWTLDDGWTEPAHRRPVAAEELCTGAGRTDGRRGLDSSALLRRIRRTPTSTMHQSARDMEANAAPAWSPPVLVGEHAASPVTGAAGPGQRRDAARWSSSQTAVPYSSNSTDQGETWSDPDAVLPDLQRHPLFVG
ncbi:MAG: hypothetical protein R2854_22170 [Caldilineaceae bacterium]